MRDFIVGFILGAITLDYIQLRIGTFKINRHNNKALSYTEQIIGNNFLKPTKNLIKAFSNVDKKDGMYYENIPFKNPVKKSKNDK